jgi:hypothetical protein
MAAFTHLLALSLRFTDGSFGVSYAGQTLGMAIAETKPHREALLRATSEPRIEFDMRVYAVALDAVLHDDR